MRVYFLSSVLAGLKIDGQYLGIIDGFEKFVECDLTNSYCVEILPQDNLTPLNFFLTPSFFTNPPSGVDVYISPTEYFIYIRSYLPKPSPIKIVKRAYYYGHNVAVFESGELFVSIDGEVTPLHSKIFTDLKEINISSYPLLAIMCKDSLLIIRSDGKIVFFNMVKECSFDDILGVIKYLPTCTGAILKVEYSYNGSEFIQTSARIEHKYMPDKDSFHFAFFECLIYNIDCKKYATPQLYERISALKNFLGEFVAVVCPPSSFYNKYKDNLACGLVFCKGNNKYDIKYFLVECKEGLIDNVIEI